MAEAKVEVEIRSFIDDKSYRRLLSWMKTNAKFVKEDYQETYYFDSAADLRVQKNSNGAKIWLKGGKIHDEAREELEIPINVSEFIKTEKLFCELGYKIKVKWFRKRFQFDWAGVKVCLDDTRGYGKIIELEIKTDNQQKDNALKKLKGKLKELDIKLTPREKFDQRFECYVQNWKKLTGKN